MSNRKLRHHISERLTAGVGLIPLLESLEGREFWHVVRTLSLHQRFDEVFQVFEWWKQQRRHRLREQHFVRFITIAGKSGRTDTAQEIFDSMEGYKVGATAFSYCALSQSYAEAHRFDRADQVLKEMDAKGLEPTPALYSRLIRTYAEQGRFEGLEAAFTGRFGKDFRVYGALIEAYCRSGQVSKMEDTFRTMITSGCTPDSRCLNAMVRGYAALGMIDQMEKTLFYFQAFQKSPTRETTVEIARAYIRMNYFYQLGEFARSLGMKTVSSGNLLWNLVLLSSAANFSMKRLQRDAQTMAASGFIPDLTSFNIRALAFSRMQMFWDLHVLVLHMKSLRVEPDLVTYGAVVDAYLSAKLQDKLAEAVAEMEVSDTSPSVGTDELVFEAFGRGKFHLYCEELEQRNATLSYSEATSMYLEQLSCSTFGIS